MIDMHSHLLYGVDDGPKTIEETLYIVEEAAAEGITDMIATPHAFSPHYHVSSNQVVAQIGLLAETIKAAGYPVTLHTGQEVRLQGNLVEKLKSKEALTLADSRYVLLELPTHSIPAYAVNIIQTLRGEGFIPIIAHPERNRAIAEKPTRLEQLVRHGALAQITAGSVAGHFGKNVQKLSLQLIEANLIHTYGSDYTIERHAPCCSIKDWIIWKKRSFMTWRISCLEIMSALLKTRPYSYWNLKCRFLKNGGN